MIHYTEKYLLNPPHKITVNLIGLGGNGSQMLSCLARINEALKGLDHPGLHVRAWDYDLVSESNVGRQLFSPADIGQHKSIVLVSRINRFFGLDWEAFPEGYVNQSSANIFISCVDNVHTRLELAAQLRYSLKSKIEEPIEKPYYWMDLGNSLKTGQVVLGTIKQIQQPKAQEKTTGFLADVVKKFPELKKIKHEDNTPSCSLAEALGKQDLFINSALVQFGAGLIWKLFREGVIRVHGCYVNIDSFQVTPMPIMLAKKISITKPFITKNKKNGNNQNHKSKDQARRQRKSRRSVSRVS